jgi:hypothetical protein
MPCETAGCQLIALHQSQFDRIIDGLSVVSLSTGFRIVSNGQYRSNCTPADEGPTASPGVAAGMGWRAHGENY